MSSNMRALFHEISSPTVKGIAEPSWHRRRKAHAIVGAIVSTCLASRDAWRQFIIPAPYHSNDPNSYAATCPNTFPNSHPYPYPRTNASPAHASDHRSDRR